jgi:hypothetical protein
MSSRKQNGSMLEDRKRLMRRELLLLLLPRLQPVKETKIDLRPPSQQRPRRRPRKSPKPKLKLLKERKPPLLERLTLDGAVPNRSRWKPV